MEVKKISCIWSLFMKDLVPNEVLLTWKSVNGISIKALSPLMTEIGPLVREAYTVTSIMISLVSVRSSSIASTVSTNISSLVFTFYYDKLPFPSYPYIWWYSEAPWAHMESLLFQRIWIYLWTLDSLHLFSAQQ